MAELELTERELAIAHGDDPDSTPPVEPEEVEAEATEEPTAIEDASPPTEEPVEIAETPASWLTAEVKELGQSYGLSDDEISSFASQDEFDRAARLFDRNLVKQSKAPEPVVPAPVKAEEKPAEVPATLDLDPEKYKEAGYDEDTVNLVRFAKSQQEKLDQLNQQMETFRQSQVQERQHREIIAFHDAVDQLDSKRFGRSVDEKGRPVPLSKEADAERRRLFEAKAEIESALAAKARAAGEEPQFIPMSVLIQRAHKYGFSDEIEADRKEQLQKDLKAQSRRRRPVSVNRPTNGKVQRRDEPNNPVDDLLANETIAARFKQYQEENGAI